MPTDKVLIEISAELKRCSSECTSHTVTDWMHTSIRYKGWTIWSLRGGGEDFRKNFLQSLYSKKNHATWMAMQKDACTVCEAKKKFLYRPQEIIGAGILTKYVPRTAIYFVKVYQKCHTCILCIRVSHFVLKDASPGQQKQSKSLPFPLPPE